MKRVFPSQGTLVKEAGKSYVEFPEAPGTAVMLAEKLYHTTGDKAGQRVKLTDKLMATIGCPQPGAGWYASEKYDGLRGIWTGKELISRPMKDSGTKKFRGKVFNFVPKSFLDLLPPGVALDGEIWMGRGQFQKVAGLSNLKVTPKQTEEYITKLWKDVVFKVFDCPSIPGPYEERMKALNAVIRSKGPIQVVESFRVKDDEHLMVLYRELTSSGAEGLMLRAPGNPYETKRSKFLLKMKVQDDSEAVVKEYLEGTGKYEGMLGSLKCVLENGTVLNIGTGLTDEIPESYCDPDSRWYIPIGCTVNFSYMELTSEGIPRHPAFRGVRTDVVIGLNHKDTIITAFDAVMKKIKTERGENYIFRLASYKKAVAAFKAVETIGSVEEALDALRASGQKLTNENPKNPKSAILLKVKEIILTGECAEAKEAQKDPASVAVENLTKIPHVGDARAGEIYSKFHIMDADELDCHEEAKALLTDAQKLGLKYRKDLVERIPRKEIDRWAKYLSAIAPGLVTGSYRRGKADSGDVDYLITQGELDSFMKNLMASKKIEILGSFGSGSTQWQGVMRLTKKSSLVRHVDIFCYPPKKLPFALLHSTGSGEFNIKCRKAAMEKGLSLSQYGLTPQPLDLVLEGSPGDQERSILEYLGINWVEPAARG